MSLMDCDRFHKAARDGFLDLLQEANRKELNSRDEDGMTPAMWAAYCGHLDALRLIIGRGGDPDKCDHYGNTSLHCASGNGHSGCVSFLVNFGVNLWALDNDYHTAKDVAVLNRRDDCLRLLDHAQSKHSAVNKKLVQRLKEKSIYDAEKRVKTYRKMQEKAAKRAEKEEKERQMDANKMTLSFRKDSRTNNGPKFSDIVNAVEKKDTTPKRPAIKKKTVVFRPGDIIRREDDSDPTHISTKDSDDDSRSRRLVYDDSDPIALGNSSPSEPSRSDTHSDGSDANSDVLQTADSGIGDDLHDSSFSPPSFGIYDRRIIPCLEWSKPGFRRQGQLVKESILKDNKDSIGSAGSLVRRHITWEDEYEVDDADDDATDDEEDEEEDEEEGYDEDVASSDPLSLLLASVGLSEYFAMFAAERIDLEALSLLSEDDLKALGMPLGPRRKLDRAVQGRMRTMREPGIVLDSRLTSYLQLASVGLSEYFAMFAAARIDLEALSLLSEEDLKALGMPLGPRRKLYRAGRGR